MRTSTSRSLHGRPPRPAGRLTDAPLTDAALGAAIRDRRSRLGLHQETLATRSGIHHTVVSRIERGERPCRVAELASLAGALNIGAAALLTDALRRDPQLPPADAA